MRRFKSIFAILLFLLLFNSCIGFNLDISLNQNGSGTINLEYIISQSLDSLGRLDGNERWNTIPVGRADFERTIDRLQDVRLLSFSSGKDKEEKNIIVQVKIGFDNLEGLQSFLDAGGLRSSFSGNGSSGSISLKLSEGNRNKNPDLDKLIAGISDSYSVKMSVSFPKEGSLDITNNKGEPLSAASRGKRVSFSFPLYDVLSSKEGLNAEFRW
jgi:hypothetical protein